uniref:Uncharacterized protein LOC100176869 n=1 Tax=Phallusia mammillata TaxID=59560 RepID=A0A6F9DG09_9ASCI|nr:uncharacterized protein LOC100176869 [Phallusia mammillata]
MSEIRMDSDEILIDISTEVSENNKPKSSLPTDMTSSSDALHQIYGNTTVPPQANSTASSSEPETSDGCFLCCGSCWEQENEGSPTRRQQCTYGARPLRKVLSNGYWYLYVLITTFLLILMMLAELLLDLGVLNDPSSQQSTVNNSPDVAATEKQPLSSTSFALHWTVLSFLSLFFIEVILRVYAWKTHLARSIVAVIDSAVVTMALACHLAATLAAGYQTPFDAISLIIVFRFIRMYSLVQYYVSVTKRGYKSKLEKAESCQAEMQILNQRLTRQILDKDFEIKQLHAHLGSDSGKFDAELQRAMSKAHGPSGNKSSFQSDMEKALALSKQAYEEENGVPAGFVNPSFQSTPERLRTRDSLPSIVVHHRENSIRRAKVDEPSTSHTPLDDFLTSQRADVSSASTSHVNVITHGQLHSEGDVTSPGDMTSLLNTSSAPSVRTWTVGYCLLQDGVPPVGTDLTDDVKAIDVTSSESDEGIGSVTSSRLTDFVGTHSRTDTSVSGATEVGCSSDPESTHTDDEKVTTSKPVTSSSFKIQEEASKL